MYSVIHDFLFWAHPSLRHAQFSIVYTSTMTCTHMHVHVENRKQYKSWWSREYKPETLCWGIGRSRIWTNHTPPLLDNANNLYLMLKGCSVLNWWNSWKERDTVQKQSTLKWSMDGDSRVMKGDFLNLNDANLIMSSLITYWMIWCHGIVAPMISVCWKWIGMYKKINVTIYINLIVSFSEV